ncbi:AAA domain-containing protein [Collimonas sp. PA-H2]|uniref:AAA family ATPase n=1 Tax=Collimonas sp. PA-H2 TaxID=1881062 RepID=UPI000BF62E5E|nr:AAA family ATPase [Collimonas sp. PA-H2]PFH10937.1 AAA domain-containing protein [Collimonas sp. PA-H2]
MKSIARSSVSPVNFLLKDLLSRTFDDDQPLLGKLILEKSVGMIAGPRGSGKSWLAMLIAYAIAGKKPLKPWGQGIGARVAILDGEMRASSLQGRFQLIRNRETAPASGSEAENNLYIISRDCVGNSIGSIDTLEGQKKIDALIPLGIRLLIIDNLSAWSAGGSESATSWALTKTWLIEKKTARDRRFDNSSRREKWSATR